MNVLESIRDRFQPDQPEPASTPTPTIDVDDALDVLANQRRRYILDVLERADEPIDKGTLAELIAARENQKRIRHLRGQERKRVYVALHQDTLPKLDRADIIEFEDPIVEPTENVAALANAKHAISQELGGASA